MWMDALPIHADVDLLTVEVAARTCLATLNLRVKARFGRNLPDEDPGRNFSDPYMEVIVVDANGNSVRKVSRTLNDDRNPDWNQYLQFGRREWKTIKVRVFDDDYGRTDDPLSIQENLNLGSLESRYGVRLNCERGYVIFDYHFN